LLARIAADQWAQSEGITPERLENQRLVVPFRDIVFCNFNKISILISLAAAIIPRGF
jgi:hypothetical protein